MADDWTPADHRDARKMIRRYALTGIAYSPGRWMREVRVARLAIALGLVAFFERIGGHIGDGASGVAGDAGAEVGRG